MAWDPQKPKIGLLDPPADTRLAHFVRILDQIGVKKHIFLKKFFFAPNDVFWVPTWPGTLKNPKLASWTLQQTPDWAILWAFWTKWGSKNAFFRKNVFAPNDVFGVPTWPGTLENPKLAVLGPLAVRAGPTFKRAQP